MARGMMKLDTFGLVIEAIERNRDAIAVVVLYHGGEPLLNKHFTTMVRRVKQAGVPFVKTVSNGMLLPDGMAEDLITSGLDAVEFSLDGQSRIENDLIRRNCDFDVVVANIKRLIDVRHRLQSPSPKIHISSTQFIESDRYVPNQPAPVPQYVVNEFSGPYRDAIESYKCTFAMRWPHMEIDEALYEVVRNPNDDMVSTYCDHVENTVTVRWNGDVVACCFDLTSRLVLGNVHAGTLETIWNGDAYLNLRRSIDSAEFVTPCDTCNVVKPNVFLALKQPRRLRLVPA